MKPNIFLIISILYLSSLEGDVLFNEGFNTSGVWPDGWTYELSINPDTGEPFTTQNWRISTDWQDPDSGYTPPGAVFEYYPRLEDFNLSMVTPDIDVGTNNAVMVRFDIALHFYNPSNETNGMSIEYDGGGGWIEILSYEIGPGAGFVEIDLRTESFIANIDGGILKVRWRAYGTDSWFINAWVIDNVRVLTLPEFSYVHIESNNDVDNQAAMEGDDVTLSLTTEATLVALPYVQMNGNEINVVAQGGGSFQSLYVVQDTDEDGPLVFSVDFTDIDGIDASTVTNTTDGSRVIIDRTGPPPFSVGDVITTGGNVFAGKWNSTNTGLEMEVQVPEDSAVVEFNYYAGNSLSFDGSNDNVTIPGDNLYQFNDNFTVEAWIKPDSWSDYEGFLNYAMDGGGSNQAGFGFVFFATGWRFYLKTEDYDDDYATMVSASTPVGQWTHLAATYDGNILTLYRNGSIIDQTEVTGDVIWSGAPEDVQLGAFTKEGTIRYFDGSMDEIRFWNVVRTSFQVKGFRNTSLEENEPGLVGYWKADTATGSVLYDQTENENNGTINGATWVTGDSPLNFFEPVYDTGVMVGATYQFRGRVSTNDLEAFGEKDTVTTADVAAMVKTISETQGSFEAITDFSHQETASISALLFDRAGNVSIGDISTTELTIDLVTNDPDPVSIVSNNINSVSLAKTGDLITITMSYDEDVNTPSVTIEGNESSVTVIGSEQFKSEYVLTGSEPEGILDFVIETVDYMGNPGDYNTSTDGSHVVYDRTLPILSLVNIASNNEDTTWAKVNDIIRVTFTASEALSSNSAIIVSQDATITDLGSNQFHADYTMTDSDPEGEITFEILFSDLAANEGVPVSITTNSTKVIFDRTPPIDFTVGALLSTGGNEVEGIWNLTNTGMNILVPVTNDTTLKNGTIQLFAKVGSNDFDSLGTSEVILSSDLNTNKVISVSGELIEGLTGFAEGENIYVKAVMTDRPGNSTEGFQSTTEVLIDETPAVLSPISVASNNANTALSIVGDEIILTVTASEELTEISVTISDQNAVVSNIEGNQFMAVYIMVDGDTEGIVTFNIGFTDIRGNPADGINTTTDLSEVTFDNTKPTLNPVSIISNNTCLSGSGAKAGDIVSITFTGEEPLLSWNAIILGDSVDVVDLGSNQYQADRELMDTDPEGNVTFLLQVVDMAGNISDDIIETTDNSDVIIDQTPPLLSFVHIESSNEISPFEAIPGSDIVTLTFQGNELLSSASVTIMGNSIDVTNDGDTYSAEYSITEDDSGLVTFSIDYSDCPGNPGETDSTTTDESFVNIDSGPPEMLSVSIYSSYGDSSWARVDDTVTVRFVATETLGEINMVIADQTVDVNKVIHPGTIYEGKRVMTDSDNEGIITFNINYADTLGSPAEEDASSTTDGSSVQFDKTSIQISDLSLVTNNAYNDSLAKTGDVATLNFSIDDAIRSLTTTLDGNEIYLSQTGFDLSYDHTFSDSNNNGTIGLSILLIDSAGYEVDTSLNRIFFDKTRPGLSDILEGSHIIDLTYTPYDDSLHLSWSAIDLESGLRNAFMAIGSESGLSDIVSWTTAQDYSSGAITGISLANNSTYYGAVHLEDLVGNMSDSLWGNGVIVDITPPETGYIWDGYLMEDIDYTSDSTELYVRWEDFSDNQIIDHFEMALGTGYDTTNIINWWTTNQMDSARIIGLDLNKEVQYHAYLRAVDGAMNVSSVISTDGIEFDNEPAKIVSISPDFDLFQVLSIIRPDTIQIRFNKPMLAFDLDIVSTQNTSLNFTTIAQDSGVIIALEDTIYGFETVSVFLDTVLAFNLLNFSDTVLFRGELWGDLDNNYQLSVEDVLLFNQKWPDSTDLGPIAGIPPYVRPLPDGQADLKDLIAFGKMWIWYYQDHILPSINNTIRILPEKLKGTLKENTLAVFIPPETHAGEMVFLDASINVNEIGLQQRKPGTFIFNVNDTLHQHMFFTFADKTGMDSILVFSIPTPPNGEFQAIVSYRFLDGNVQEIGRGIGELNLQLLPDRFIVHQNYPNPFNAETIIHYEIPDPQPISIHIYDLLGRKVRSAEQIKHEAGKHMFRWKGNNDFGEQVSSGIYFLHLSAGKESKRMKMVLLK